VFNWRPLSGIPVTPAGEFVLEFPPECPLRLDYSQFTSEVRITPNYHSHIEVTLLYEGAAIFTVENRRYEMAEGDIMIIGQGEFHFMEASSAKPIKVFSLHFLPDLIHRPGSLPLDMEYLRPFGHHGPGFAHRIPAGAIDGPVMFDRLRRIHDELNKRERGWALAARTFLADILLEIARHYGKGGKVSEERNDRMLNVQRLSKVFNYINQNCAEPIAPKKLASLANMSPGYFSRFFRAVTGITPTNYVMRARVDMATKYLLNTTMSVTEIAYASGFGSASYFDRVFKSAKGMTPHEFRRQMGHG
jgi:AraC-like DNA-binding protein/mannose-6-phosphate isomerase-like protein (cupin superfamily)